VKRFEDYAGIALLAVMGVVVAAGLTVLFGYMCRVFVALFLAGWRAG
jgi:hypothetical protein